MAQLLYITNASLDGYIEDSTGAFDWSTPGEDLHRFFNDLVRPLGTFLYGRRLYETMAVWETDPTLAAGDPILRDFAESWQSASKIVYSRSLDHAATRNTRIERAFDPAAVRQLVQDADQDFAIGGAELAAQAFQAGLIDEVHLVLAPILVGGGKPAFPTGIRRALALQEQRGFANGTVYLRYRCSPPEAR